MNEEANPATRCTCGHLFTDHEEKPPTFILKHYPCKLCPCRNYRFDLERIARALFPPTERPQ